MAAIALAMGADGRGQIHCGDILGQPYACWRYCNGNSGTWCYTDMGHECDEVSLLYSGGTCKGKSCYWTDSKRYNYVPVC